MKKLIVLVLTLLMLCGCAAGVQTAPEPAPNTPEAAPIAPETAPNEPEAAPKLPEETQESLVPIPFEPVDVQIEPSSAPLKEPDTLAVVSGSRSVQLSYGSCSWWYENGDGTVTSLEACGAHPLDCRNSAPLLDMDGAGAQFYFGAEAADAVTVRCWSVADWGNCDAPAETIPVENMTFTLKETGCVYEVCATWNRAEAWGGSAYYVFCTSPLGLTLHAEAVTERGMTLVFEQSGGTPTGTLQTGTEYWLEVNEDGCWQRVEAQVQEYVWEDVAHMLEPNGETRLEIDWEELYGRLPAGRYRLGKEIMDFRGPGDYDIYRYYSDNFAIEWLDLQ